MIIFYYILLLCSIFSINIYGITFEPNIFHNTKSKLINRNNYNIGINQRIEINEVENKFFLKIFTDIFKEYFSNSSAIISLKMGFISSEKFLDKYGEEAWLKVEDKFAVMYDTHSDRTKLMSMIENAIISIDALPESFEIDVKIGKIQTKKIYNEIGKVVEIFEIESYENNWNFIQKFCYRRELRLNGFTFWFRGKLETFKEKLLR